MIPEWGDLVVKYVNEVEDELDVKVCSDEEAYPSVSYTHLDVYKRQVLVKQQH